jgi:hypothetical protein
LAHVALADSPGLGRLSTGSARPDYSIGAAIPLGFADGSLAASYVRVTDPHGISRDGVVTTHLDLHLSDAVSLSASLARTGANPFAGDSTWRAEARYAPGSLSLGAGISHVDPDLVRLGYFGPTMPHTGYPMRGVAGSFSYTRGDSLTIHGGLEGYGRTSVTELAFWRYVAGIGYTLNERLALDLSLARAATFGFGDSSTSYAALGIDFALSPDATLKLLYGRLDLQNDANAPTGSSASSVMATQFSVAF